VLRVTPGPPARVLLERAAEFQADLVVLGPHSKASFFDFGSTARAVLSRTVTPVWSQLGAVEPVTSILVPVDFSAHSREALNHARALAERLHASVRVLHCYEPPTFAFDGTFDGASGPTYVVEQDRGAAEEELVRWMEDVDWGPVEAQSSFVEGAPARRIAQHAAAHDLVVMGTHGRTGLTRFVLGSVTYAVLRRSPVPVLAIPSPSREWLLGDLA
jgi:nucleotide-binding universal stress UspA family protein